MRISSQLGDARIDLVRNVPEDEYGDFSLTVERTDGTKRFFGINDSVVLSGFSDFLAEFDHFVESRDGNAVLQMSEECRIEFFRWNAVGDIGVRGVVNVFGFSSDTLRSSEYKLEATFKIDGEFIGSVQRELHGLETDFSSR